MFWLEAFLGIYGNFEETKQQQQQSVVSRQFSASVLRGRKSSHERSAGDDHGTLLRVQVQSEDDGDRPEELPLREVLPGVLADVV